MPQSTVPAKPRFVIHWYCATPTGPLNHRHLVYALRDPETKLFRYIGKSSRGMARPREHGYDSQRDRARRERGALRWSAEQRECENRRYKWIRDLHARGLEYEIIVLEVLSPGSTVTQLNAQEIAWIALFWPSGLLFNVSPGGDAEADAHAGGATQRAFWAQAAPEARQARSGQISESQRKRWQSIPPEQRSEMMRGNGHNFNVHLAELTPEQRSARAKKAAAVREARMTPEQRQARRERRRQTWEQLSPDERAEQIKKTQEGRRKAEESLTPEQRSEQHRLRSIRAKAKAAARTAEERSESARKGRLTRPLLTPEQRRERILERGKERRRRIRAARPQKQPRVVTPKAPAIPYDHSEAKRQWHAQRTPEQRKATAQKRLQSLDTDQLADSIRKSWAQLNPEQRRERALKTATTKRANTLAAALAAIATGQPLTRCQRDMLRDQARARTLAPAQAPLLPDDSCPICSGMKVDPEDPMQLCPVCGESGESGGETPVGAAQASSPS